MSTLVEQLIQTEAHQSIFESAVRQLPLPVCAAFGSSSSPQPVSFKNTGRVLSTKDSDAVRAQFPQSVAASNNIVLTSSGSSPATVQGKRVAVLFSGGPAAGGHNVVCGLKRVLGSGNTLLGVRAGPKGLLKGSLFEITDANVDFILNTGGFDFLGSDRTKIKSDEQFAQVRETCIKHQLDAIVVVGGDDSNTNAAVLAESLFTGVKADGSGVQVIGVPKTIDGDLQIGDLLSISFGFDTATRIYSEMVGNILQDTSSSLKYWHFVKLMGRSASHVALEVALQTKPAITLISEEIAANQESLASIIDRVARVIVERSHRGMNYGVLLAPEGLIEFIPEMNAMIAELNDVLAHHAADFAAQADDAKPAFVGSRLSPENASLLASLPHYIVNMLLAERDSHGNLQVSLIPTEQLLIDMARQRVRELDANVPFAAHSHFLGYEGRCGAPTLFDAAYTYNLGLTAGSLILDGRTGYMATITGLASGGTPQAIPLAGLLNIERRHGKNEFVIEKALVKMDSPAMQYFVSRREAWAASDLFASPGPRQFWGPTTDQLPISVALNSGADALMFKIG
ncbi:MAG: diphosphate--fructose-6-phosphate 1-phosphotransferase [Candidatus Accumulibacter phosphatis]|uniref:Diphosphate--fructose-6-phosphate 1-phosphotransferase n=3 Tax=Candidatus Accumulibacter TaxID=327159 RepID=A0A7D5SDC6_9PROT|nr:MULTISPECIES: diphosphate--fructose-6-phosphate 1-phosphotransferase [Candidatus Accumulibacter]QLH52160.1 MAG: diphosphate--fructose-6-phosphate 1-phosphotransferase [Candidatus Accumulibacter cognatus]MBN8517745.1 diphosphate--fructose-6-phosphate 1-phosphotransferase [Accumulibacter sp.]MBO3711906.1 diphosphate--fructose-6-phosphate 1-phosphotransferase [Accumulibacter sp.]MCC2867330.1 diphosphate--fructose-6-phosphate 1-phosphotransferase [Candidatus Accumulibacter phosphatis]MCM8578511